jgi:uncharacterized protein YcfL
MTKYYNAIVLAFMWVACVSPEGNKQQSDLTHLSDDSLLTLVRIRPSNTFGTELSRRRELLANAII